jgi:hypothetical protein
VRASFRVRDGLTVEVEGESQKDLFRELASAAEVFGEKCCGLCGDAAIVPVCRTVEKFDFFEWHCTGCGARLSMGQLKDGDRLFPSRRLDAHGKPDREHGTAGDHKGWSHYKGDVEPPKPPAKTAAAPKGTPAMESSITEAQWNTIKAELAKHGIGQRAFLERFKWASPRAILGKHFAEALALAKNPDDELRAMQAAGRP